jgi:hypothetical protein
MRRRLHERWAMARVAHLLRDGRPNGSERVSLYVQHESRTPSEVLLDKCVGTFVAVIYTRNVLVTYLPLEHLMVLHVRDFQLNKIIHSQYMINIQATIPPHIISQSRVARRHNKSSSRPWFRCSHSRHCHCDGGGFGRYNAFGRTNRLVTLIRRQHTCNLQQQGY